MADKTVNVALQRINCQRRTVQHIHTRPRNTAENNYLLWSFCYPLEFCISPPGQALQLSLQLLLFQKLIVIRGSFINSLPYFYDPPLNTLSEGADHIQLGFQWEKAIEPLWLSSERGNSSCFTISKACSLLKSPEITDVRYENFIWKANYNTNKDLKEPENYT